jgi:uncharacterized protein YlxW (UPF0749 family)
MKSLNFFWHNFGFYFDYFNKTIQTTLKCFLSGKFIAMNAYIKRTERSQINDIMLHLKLLEKQEQANSKTKRREIIKIRAEINEVETKKPYKELMKQKVGSLKK